MNAWILDQVCAGCPDSGSQCRGCLGTSKAEKKPKIKKASYAEKEVEPFVPEKVLDM